MNRNSCKEENIKPDDVVMLKSLAEFDGWSYTTDPRKGIELFYGRDSFCLPLKDIECLGRVFTVSIVHEESKHAPKRYSLYGCDNLFPWWMVRTYHQVPPLNVVGYYAEKVYDVPKIKEVKFSNPATIVWFEDGDKVVVKANKGDRFDGEKGLAMALCKKVYGTDYYNLFKKFVWGKKDKLKVGDKVKQGKILRFNKQGSKALVQTKTKQAWIDRKLIEEE